MAMPSFLPSILGLLTTLITALPVTRVYTRSSVTVPEFILDFAPLVWLDAYEEYFPTDLATFLSNVHPTFRGATVEDGLYPLGPNNLDALNSDGEDVYLSSDNDFSTSPRWIRGILPDGDGKAGNTISCAIVMHDKGQGTIDAFYFYFYGYNQGNTVLLSELGDHVGDWEHTMIRFQDGRPKTAWLSQHEAGGAFQYAALENQGGRAVIYAAKGTHANYATTGTHDHTIPGLPLGNGLLEDTTGKGKLWDPVKNSAIYSVTFPDGTSADDSSNPFFAPYTDVMPSNWLSFIGHWGDAQLPDDDPRQQNFLGFRTFVGGPTGPRDKKLNRSRTCPNPDGVCIEWDALLPGS